MVGGGIACGDLGVLAQVLDFREVMLTSPPELAHCAPPPSKVSKIVEKQSRQDVRDLYFYIACESCILNYPGEDDEQDEGVRISQY